MLELPGDNRPRVAAWSLLEHLQWFPVTGSLQRAGRGTWHWVKTWLWHYDPRLLLFLWGGLVPQILPMMDVWGQRIRSFGSYRGGTV